MWRSCGRSRILTGTATSRFGTGMRTTPISITAMNTAEAMGGSPLGGSRALRSKAPA